MPIYSPEHVPQIKFHKMFLNRFFTNVYTLTGNFSFSPTSYLFHSKIITNQSSSNFIDAFIKFLI